jgi:hypothetical protein
MIGLTRSRDRAAVEVDMPGVSWIKARAFGAAIALAALSLPLAASAQTIYKLIHKDGKVTYSESEPKNFDGKVVPMNVNPDANTVSLPKPPQGAAKGEPPPERNADGIRRAKRPDGAPSSGDKVQDAKDRLEAARQALKEAQDNPGENDLTWIGNKAGGTRPIPSEAYQKRLERLEADVRRAEEELKVAEKG